MFSFPRLVLTAFCLFPLVLTARAVSPSCKGPADLEQATTAHPSAGVYDSLGAYFASHGQLSCAISSFEAAVKLEPDSWEGHYNLGIALLTNKNAKGAARELQMASKLKPDSAKVLLPLGVALSQLNQQNAAMDAFRAVLKQDPQSVQALDGLTKALIAEKRYTAAIAALKNATSAVVRSR